MDERKVILAEEEIPPELKKYFEFAFDGRPIRGPVQCKKCGGSGRAKSDRVASTDSSYETGTTANRLALLRQTARSEGDEYHAGFAGAETGEPCPACLCPDCNGTGYAEYSEQWKDGLPCPTCSGRGATGQVEGDVWPENTLAHWPIIPCTVLDPMAGCYDRETEILTKGGWKSFPELVEDDLILTRLENGLLEYHRPLRLITQKWNGPVVKIKTRSIDLLITPDHKMLVRRHHNQQLMFCSANELKYSIYYIPVKTVWNAQDLEEVVFPSIPSSGHQNIRKPLCINGDDFMFLLGIYIAEGSATPYGGKKKNGGIIQIKQTNTEKRTFIADRLKSLPLNLQVGKNYIRLQDRRLFDFLHRLGHAPDKHIPPEFKSVSVRQLKILWDALVLGDGSTRRNGRNQVVYTSSKVLTDDLQEILVKLGYGCTVTSRAPRDSIIRGRIIRGKLRQYTVYRLVAHYRKFSTTQHVTMENYEGDVFCVEVPNHTVYVRRNGRAVWCGNSGTTGRAALNLGRSAILNDLKPEYAQLCRERLEAWPGDMPQKKRARPVENLEEMRRTFPGYPFVGDKEDQMEFAL